MLKHALLILLFQLSRCQLNTNPQAFEDLDPVEPLEDTMFPPNTYYYINKLAEILNFLMLVCGLWRMWKGKGPSAEDLVTENEELRQKYEELVKEEENLQKQIKEQEKTISLLIAMLREKNKKAADSNTTEVGRKYADMTSLWDTGIKNPGDQMKGNDLNHQPTGISTEGSGKDALEFD
ncbi:uncharacterized protein LOC131949056 [Physella acuta]|uniref:uncharacterized protein LOC131949056 n=1 Tax=Physella acuta TaxID=109671 RepID=UPI0027DD5E9F|nr:uncharacterized protein LOC131949056 [Physella acuta]